MSDLLLFFALLQFQGATYHKMQFRSKGIVVFRSSGRIIVYILSFNMLIFP